MSKNRTKTIKNEICVNYSKEDECVVNIKQYLVHSHTDKLGGINLLTLPQPTNSHLQTVLFLMQFFRRGLESCRKNVFNIFIILSSSNNANIILRKE